VAAIYSVGLRDMDQYVRRFEHLESGAQVEIEYLHPDRVYEKVEAGTADFGLVSFPQPSRKLTAVPWREEEMVVACPPGHPFAERGRVAVRDLDGQRYVAFDRGLEIRRKVDRLLKDHGASVSIAHEFDNIENIKQSIEVSGGVALLPIPALERELWAGTLVAVPLADARFVRPLAIVHRRSPAPGATARRFMDLLRQPEEPPVGAGLGAFWASRGGDR
jgi:DNA-binding transcriptional LysR family regulator